MENEANNRVEWAASTNIYEVNIRQYTPEGTFNAFARSLPRLRMMSVETLWLRALFQNCSAFLIAPAPLTKWFICLIDLSILHPGIPADSPNHIENGNKIVDYS